MTHDAAQYENRAHMAASAGNFAEAQVWATLAVAAATLEAATGRQIVRKVWRNNEAVHVIEREAKS